MKYKNLRKQTILDYTQDKKILDELIGDTQIFLENLTDLTRAQSLIDYAEYINDKEMIQAVETEFKTEFAEFFNE